jgi:peptidoglycan/xylan/chitin deacetylase (PgdA/CDA1 family)
VSSTAHWHEPPAFRHGPPTFRQLLAGLIAIPLSALPILGYLALTPEGRLVRDRAWVALAPPTLPALSAEQRALARSAAPRYKDALMALVYHGIGSASDGERGYVVSPERFGEHLAFLRAAGLNPVTASQVAEALLGNERLPDNAVMISFDDGRSDALMFADPLLDEAGMVATMFVITDAASDPGVYYAGWDELESYARSGRWDLQSHSADLHYEQQVNGGGVKLPALTSLADGESRAEYRERIRGDLERAAAALERHTGDRPAAFAYPFGAYGADRTNSRSVRSVVHEEVGRVYAIAFHQDEQESVPLLSREMDPLGLRRLEVGEWSGPELLRRIAGASRNLKPRA